MTMAEPSLNFGSPDSETDKLPMVAVLIVLPLYESINSGVGMALTVVGAFALALPEAAAPAGFSKFLPKYVGAEIDISEVLESLFSMSEFLALARLFLQQQMPV